MQLSKMNMSLALLILSSTAVLAAPIPQGAGVGQGCDAILTDADTGSGLAVKEAGQNAASLLKSAGVRRQGAGVGDACNAILTDADTGSGLAVKEAGQNLASLLKSAGARRQLDKAGAGTAAVISIVDPNLASYQEGLTNVIDGDGTSDSAVVGEQMGALEAQMGEGAGDLVPSSLSTSALQGTSSGSTSAGSSAPAGPAKPAKGKPAPPKRQLDKVGAGTAAIISLVSPDLASEQEGLTNTLDGAGTSDSAAIGQKIGDVEVQVGTSTGNLVPASLPAGL